MISVDPSDGWLDKMIVLLALAIRRPLTLHDRTSAGIHAPSFHAGTPEEEDVCKGLIRDPEGLRDLQS